MRVGRIVGGSLRRLLRAALHATAGAAVVLLVGGVVFLNDRPDLSVWHTADLDEEFTADSGIESFAEYLELEDRLFAQLQEEVYAKIDPADRNSVIRFHRGSLSDPTSYPKNWNRSFELKDPNAPVAVLLLHGMSDSPYSMRSLAQRLHAGGIHVLGLRMPGHGTAPVGLTEATWQDMAAAVRMAMRHLESAVPGRPICLVGYSNGGALAVHYSLESLRDESLTRPARVVLLSPEIGITGLAALAIWQERLGDLLGLEKLRWNSLGVEYDPYKYGAFAINAGVQAYALTEEVRRLIGELGPKGLLRNVPDTLAFQSVTDATVSVSATVTGFFDQLTQEGSELVLFDLNRTSDIEVLLKSDPVGQLSDLLIDRSLPFLVTVVTNAPKDEASVVARSSSDSSETATEVPLDLAWPPDLYSLAHISLPFPPDDPIYGPDGAEGLHAIEIGRAALRGESGVLLVSPREMLRLRWNPFHRYVADRTVAWIQGAVGS